MAPAREGWFVAADPVGRYWLTRCDGFEVRSPSGRTLGKVTEVEDVFPERRVLVVQRRRHLRRRQLVELEANAVTAVDPWQRLLVAPSPASNRLVGATRGLIGPALVALRLAARAGRTVPARTSSLARLSGSGGRHAFRAVSTEGRRAHRWLRPADRIRRAGAFAWNVGLRVLHVGALLLWLYAQVVFRVASLSARMLGVVARGIRPAGRAISSRL